MSNPKNSGPQRMFAETVLSRNTGIPDTDKFRTRVRNWSLRRRDKDPIASAAHQSLVSRDTSIEIQAAFRQNSKVFVEQVCVSVPMNSIKGVMSLPSLPVTEDLAQLSGRLLSMEVAERAVIRNGIALEGNVVAFFESGINSIDRRARDVLSGMEELGYRLDHAPKTLLNDVRDLATLHVPRRHSWRSDLKIAFLPPEQVFEVASQRMEVEEWLMHLGPAGETRDQHLLELMSSYVSRTGTMLAGGAGHLYDELFLAIRRHISSFRAEIHADGGAVEMHLRAAEPAGNKAD